MAIHARNHSSHKSSSFLDIEKQPPKRQSDRLYRRNSSGSENTADSPSSSVASFQPMLNDSGGSSIRWGRMGLGFPRASNRILRWLCLALLVVLLLLVLVLFRFALSASTQPLPGHVTKPQPPQWEKFPFLKRYYGGIRALVSRSENVPEYPGHGSEEGVVVGDSGTASDNTERKTLEERGQQLSNISSAPFDPYPAYDSEEYIKKYGEKHDCFLDVHRKVRLPLVHHFPGLPHGFPESIMGSNKMMGIQDGVCFDRFGRLGPYGLGYGKRKGGSGAGLDGDRDGAERVWDDIPPVDFRKVDWAVAQNRCITANSHRFNGLAKLKTKGQARKGTDRLPRTAVVIRTWHDFRYSTDDILYLRSLISELSLLSGGEYVVHFLVHLKDENLRIWSDDRTYKRVLRDALPEEFRGMATFWSERQMTRMYPGLEETWTRGLPIHGVYRSTFMPMQYFGQTHPEYDYYWNWEMDARYTGHWYQLFDKITSWAKQQPRKGLWERNARFYVPSVHGSWENFRQTVHWQTQTGTNTPNQIWNPIKPSGQDQPGNEVSQPQGDKFIWGPERPAEPDIFQVDGEGIPPTTMEKDQYNWGVGEDADLIAFNPLYDPEGTTWILRDDVTGYDKKNGMPPRRTSIITASRLSRKLLHTMHNETSLKRHSMFSEMWPATTALHHGFKAVYVPHSVYVDRQWPPRYLESVFNAGRNGAAGGARTAVFGDREHNFRGTTWFYSAGFSGNLWRRWLGIRVDNDGGEQEELAGEGRMCLPPMLLHPIKDVELIAESGIRPEGWCFFFFFFFFFFLGLLGFFCLR